MQRHPESPVRLKLQKGASINDVSISWGGGVKNLETLVIHNCEKVVIWGIGGVIKLCKFGDIIYGWPPNSRAAPHCSVVVLNGF